MVPVPWVVIQDGLHVMKHPGRLGIIAVSVIYHANIAKTWTLEITHGECFLFLNSLG